VALSHRRRVLAYRTLGLGDLLTAVPALRGLANGFGNHRIVVAMPEPLHALIALIHPRIEAVAIDELGPVPPALHGADVAVNLHGRGPLSHRTLLAARPASLLAFAHPDVPSTGSGPPWSDEEHEVARWCRLLSTYGIAAHLDDLHLAAPPEPSPAPRGATVIHPGATSAARRWPAERWTAVAEAERKAGRPVVITGSSAERPLAEGVATGAGLARDAVLAGRTALSELAAVVAGAGRVACGDTGVAHLTTALGTPSVVLFGPTPPSLWGPPPGRPQHVTLWTGRAGDPHGDVPDPGLLEIGVDDVVAALDRLPDREGAGAA
jgi:ADP-heptose:LPS heptosyltransferase